MLKTIYLFLRPSRTCFLENTPGPYVKPKIRARQDGQFLRSDSHARQHSGAAYPLVAYAWKTAHKGTACAKRPSARDRWTWQVILLKINKNLSPISLHLESVLRLLTESHGTLSIAESTRIVSIIMISRSTWLSHRAIKLRQSSKITECSKYRMPKKINNKTGRNT